MRGVSQIHFWSEKAGHCYTPNQQVCGHIVPHSDKYENYENIEYSARERPLGSAKRNVHIANEPSIEADVPALPESLNGIIVVHTALHIFDGFDPVCESPKSKEFPHDQEFKPKRVDQNVGIHHHLDKS
eukprot:976333_1